MMVIMQGQMIILILSNTTECNLLFLFISFDILFYE